MEYEKLNKNSVRWKIVKCGVRSCNCVCVCVYWCMYVRTGKFIGLRLIKDM